MHLPTSFQFASKQKEDDEKVAQNAAVVLLKSNQFTGTEPRIQTTEVNVSQKNYILGLILLRSFFKQQNE